MYFTKNDNGLEYFLGGPTPSMHILEKLIIIDQVFGHFSNSIGKNVPWISEEVILTN